MKEPKTDLFSMYPQSFHNSFEEWFGNMTELVVQNSPNIFIRSCAEVHDIFSIAFLSCWEQTGEDIKKDFSATVEAVLVKFLLRKYIG